MRREHGFSLVELLVCMAIILILMALYLPVLGRAKEKAMDVAVKEGLRQERIGYMADRANGGGDPTPGREECRQAYRHTIDIGRRETAVTELRYVVQTAAQFRAYWHTLINPDASGKLEFEQGLLVARDEQGNTHYLMPMGKYMADGGGGLVPVAWDFLSTVAAECGLGSAGTEVIFSDGSVKHYKYPGAFPAIPVVAELSHRYMLEYE